MHSQPQQQDHSSFPWDNTRAGTLHCFNSLPASMQQLILQNGPPFLFREDLSHYVREHTK